MIAGTRLRHRVALPRFAVRVGMMRCTGAGVNVAAGRQTIPERRIEPGEPRLARVEQFPALDTGDDPPTLRIGRSVVVAGGGRRWPPRPEARRPPGASPLR